MAKYCPDSLCDDTTCKGHPHAKCLISRCGGCSVKFYKHDELVKCAGHNKGRCHAGFTEGNGEGLLLKY